MGFVKRAVVAMLALGAGALLVANWRSQNDLHRKFEALAATLSGKPSESAVPGQVRAVVAGAARRRPNRACFRPAWSCPPAASCRASVIGLHCPNT